MIKKEDFIVSQHNIQEFLNNYESGIASDIQANINLIVKTKDDEIASLQEQVERMHKRMEMLEEQNFFACEVFDNIKSHVKMYNKAKELKEAIRLTFDDTFFEY